jgi:hypothetical protein
MSNLPILDSTGATKYVSFDGAGSSTDPYTHATVLRDRSGNAASVGVFGELLTGSSHSHVEVAFSYPVIDTNFDVDAPVTTGDGTITNTTGVLVASSTTGTASLTSKKHILYKPGHTSYARFTLAASGAGAAEAGVRNANGDKFSVKIANNVLSFIRARAGVATEVLSSNFNGQYSVGNLTLTNVNIFEIRWGFLGVADPQLWVFGPNGGGWQLLHVERTAGNLTTSHVQIPSFNIFISSTGAMTAKTISWNGGSYGGDDSVGARYFQHAASKTLTTTDETTVMHYKVKDTYQGLTNMLIAQAIRVAFFCGASAANYGTVEFRIYGNATTTGVSAPVDINTMSSGVQYDPGLSYSSGGVLLYTDWAGYTGANKAAGVGAAVFNARDLGLFGHASDTFTVTAKLVEGSDVVVVRSAFNWVERP